MSPVAFEEKYELESGEHGTILVPAGRAKLDVSSQHGELTVVLDLLESQPDAPKFVVDVGAHDGISLSNTFPLIQNGWGGVLVEPMPKPFAKLELLYADNPVVSLVNKACSNRAGRQKLFVGIGGDEGQSATLSTDEALDVIRGEGQIEVEVETLTNVLHGCGAPHDFSLLSVDAEGMDYEVLQGFDFSTFRPRIILSEEYEVEPKHKFLEENGYTLYGQLGCNTIWTTTQLADQI